MAYDLIPQPQHLRVACGGFAADMRAEVFAGGASDVPAEFLGEAVYERTSFLLDVDYEPSEDHVLWISAKGAPEREIARAKKALAKAGDDREAYGLVVSASAVAAAANAPAGLLYAAATAAQLLDTRDGRPFWPACTISDRPDLELRAVHLDLKHHMEKLDYLGAMIPRLAAFKVNGLLLEIEDKFLYKSRGEVSAPIGFSAGELQELVHICREYNVELIPLVQGLGHASYILKHPQHAALREKKDSFAEFCPQNEGTYELLFDLYDEVAAATEGTRYFHIGGDEAWLMGACPKCAKALKTRSKFELYEEWLSRSADHVRKLGRIPMVWDDMLLKDAADDWSKLPKDLFYVRWSYRADAAEKNRATVERYGKSGLRALVAGSTQTGYAYAPLYMSEQFPNIEGWAKAAAREGLAGMVTTAWEDTGTHTETFWPGYAATGETGWNAKMPLDFDYLVKFTRIFHGATDGRIASAWRTVSESVVDAYNLLAPGGPYKIDEMISLPPLVPAESGKRWRETYADRILTAARLAAELGEAEGILSRAILSGRHSNTYALEVLLASNRLMLARVDVFFALRDAEAAVEDAHAAFFAGDKARAGRIIHDAAVGIYDALAAAQSGLSALESVWEVTRFPQDMSLFESPDDRYLHDFNNYTHLAARTKDLSYFTLVERRIGAWEMAERMMRASREMRGAKAWPFGAAE